jgi:hypothetical protein
MSDLSVNIARRLTQETGIMAGRLARLLEATFAGAGGQTAGHLAFLQARFHAVSPDLPLEHWNPPVRSRAVEGETHPLDRVIEGLALSEEETRLLILSGMAEEHEGYAAVLRTLHPRGEPWPTAGLAAQMLFPGEERMRIWALLEDGGAIHGGALNLAGEFPLFERSLAMSEGLWSALHGVASWPAIIERFSCAPALHGLDEWLANSVVRRAVTALERNEACTILVSGEGEDNLIWRALALVLKAGREGAGILLPASVTPELRRLIQIHAIARHVVPVLLPSPTETSAAVTVAGFGNFPATLVLCARPGGVFLRAPRPLIAVAAENLHAPARRRMWEATLPGLAPHASFLAARYPIEPAGADQLSRDLRTIEKLEERPAVMGDFVTSVRARAALSLSGAVKLVKPAATMDDLVLPQGRLDQLWEAVQRLALQVKVLDDWGFLKGRTGGRGVRMLFYGPPGTGKTISAEAMANALNVDLLIVDLSRVLSKWIGETEKNLSAVFDSAEHAQAVLFFDEADALFGKRTEVSDAHDRYANMETAYLLQRLERFEGLAILATNMKQNIDAAFMRRLEFAVEFDEPDSERRRQLWKNHIPDNAPLTEDVNIYELSALYPVVGGFIRNASVAAAFLAAQDKTKISRLHLVRAIRREYDKTGKAFPGLPVGMKT